MHDYLDGLTHQIFCDSACDIFKDADPEKDGITQAQWGFMIDALAPHLGYDPATEPPLSAASKEETFLDADTDDDDHVTIDEYTALFGYECPPCSTTSP